MPGRPHSQEGLNSEYPVSCRDARENLAGSFRGSRFWPDFYLGVLSYHYSCTFGGSSGVHLLHPRPRSRYQTLVSYSESKTGGCEARQVKSCLGVSDWPGYRLLSPLLVSGTMFFRAPGFWLWISTSFFTISHNICRSSTHLNLSQDPALLGPALNYPVSDLQVLGVSGYFGKTGSRLSVSSHCPSAMMESRLETSWRDYWSFPNLRSYSDQKPSIVLFLSSSYRLFTPWEEVDS